MKYYSGNYDFDCENKEILSTGNCHVSFYLDDYGDAINIDIELQEFEVWDINKESQIQTIRNYHINDIKSLIEEDAIQYLIEHDLY